MESSHNAELATRAAAIDLTGSPASNTTTAAAAANANPYTRQLPPQLPPRATTNAPSATQLPPKNKHSAPSKVMMLQPASSQPHAQQPRAPLAPAQPQTQTNPNAAVPKETNRHHLATSAAAHAAAFALHSAQDLAANFKRTWHELTDARHAAHPLAPTHQSQYGVARPNHQRPFSPAQGTDHLATLEHDGGNGGGPVISPQERDRQLQEMVQNAVSLAENVDMSLADVEGMRCTLLPHQVQGVQWMRAREGGKFCGGILADDMGLGKTVQMLSLIVCNRPGRKGSTLDQTERQASAADVEMDRLAPAAAKQKHRAAAAGEGTTAKKEGERAAKTTLIVAPVAVVKQWEREVRDKTDAGLRVLVHHGSGRAKRSADLAKYDLVITTYTTASSEWGNFAPDAAAKKRRPKKKGDDNGTAAAQTTRNGADSDDDDGSEGSDDDEGDAAVHEKRGADSSDEDVVRPGRGKADAKPAAASQKKPKPCPLFEMDWLRVVLDEAQNIKNHRAKMSLACFALSRRARSRWCLSGTPIQNNVYELYSLIHFLRVPPFDDYKLFKEKIGDPLKSTNQNRVNWGMKRLAVILKSIMLRRTKDSTLDGKPLLSLPKRTVKVVSTDFDDPEERAFYKRLEDKVRRNLQEAEERGGKVNQMTTLVMLLRLRQACSHPALVSRKLADDASAISAPEPVTATDASSASATRGAADDDDGLADLLSTLSVATRHCERCHAVLPPPPPSSSSPPPQQVTTTTKGLCAECDEAEREARSRGAAEWTSEGKGSTKVRLMLKLLDEVRREGSGEKTIVFSQFTSFLDLVEPFLVRNKLKHVRYDGSMRADQREAALERIRNDESTTVLLLSFKAGSTGLNLTCCSRVILMDLWWNPQIEEQAFDRAHRLGQTRDVIVTKLSIVDSVEERILALQDKKRQLSNAALEGGKLTKGKANQLTREELLSLFNAGDADGATAA